MMGLIALFAVVYAATVLIVGEPLFLIPGALIVLIASFFVASEHTLTKIQLRRHGGDPMAAMRDENDPLPSTHLIPDDSTGAGDTPEAHDEISPHDYPVDSPGRQAAEAQAGSHAGTTGGNEQGAHGGRFERREDRTEERTGEPQRDAERGKSAVGSAGRPDATEREPGQRFPL